MRFIDIKSLHVMYYQQFDRSMGLGIINEFLKSHFAACTTLWGLTFKDNAELLYCNFLFKLSFIVHASLGNRGNNETEFVTSAGTFTICPLILTCFPLGACISFWNANLGSSSLDTNSFKLKNAGLFRNFIPFTAAHGGTYSWLNISHMIYKSTLYYQHLFY